MKVMKTNVDVNSIDPSLSREGYSFAGNFLKVTRNISLDSIE